MSRISNVRKTTKFYRSIKAISPVIATLLMIAIAVVASLVVYAWVTGYIGGQTSTAGKAIQIQSYYRDPTTGLLTVYVQNVGQGTVEFKPGESIFVNNDLVKITSALQPLAAGQTAELKTDKVIPANERVQIKVTTTDGTFMTVSGTPTSGSGNSGGGSLSISVQPASQTINSGQTATLTSTVTGGTAPYSWQWYHGAGAISGASGTGATATYQTGTADTGIYVTFTDAHSLTATSSPTVSVTVNSGPGPLDHFGITVPASCTSHTYFGSSNNVVVTAYDASGAVKTDYTGYVWFTSSDTDSSVRLPFDNNPTTDRYQFTAGDAGVHTFTSTGSSGFRLITTPSQTITVTDGTISKTSSSITVNAGAFDHFAFSHINDMNEGVYFSVTITAQDEDGNTVSSFSGAQTLQAHNLGSGSSITPTSITFANGVWSSSQVRIYVSSDRSNVHLNINYLYVDYASNDFDVNNL